MRHNTEEQVPPEGPPLARPRSAASPAGQGATPRRVLVAGNSRSGTTMLARMLGRHSAVLALQELHFVEELWQPGSDPLDRATAEALAERLLHNQRRWYHEPATPGEFRHEAASVVAPLDAPVPATEVLAAVLASEAKRAGARIAVEQTPRNVFYVAELLDALPDTLVVVVVRDPRDVLLSQKNWWRRRFRGTSGVPLRTTLRQWADYHPVTTSLLWRGGVRAGLRAAADPRVVLVRFEDLVTRPHEQLEPILARLGLAWEPAVLDAPRISSSNAADRSGTGVDPSVVGRFRDGLSSTELWLNQRLTAREAASLGYARVPVPTPLAGLAVAAASWPLKTALAVALNRGRARSLVGAARRRLAP